jgi:hypothetical protein
MKMGNVGRVEKSLMKANKPTADGIPIGTPSTGWPLGYFGNCFVQTAEDDVD